MYIHGLNSIDDRSRVKKKEAGLWEEIEKNGQKVYVDINIRITDAEGKPIRQGKFKNTGVSLEADQLQKVENHLYLNKGRKSHSIRKLIQANKAIRDKNKKANK